MGPPLSLAAGGGDRVSGREIQKRARGARGSRLPCRGRVTRPGDRDPGGQEVTFINKTNYCRLTKERKFGKKKKFQTLVFNEQA